MRRWMKSPYLLVSLGFLVVLILFSLLPAFRETFPDPEMVGKVFFNLWLVMMVVIVIVRAIRKRILKRQGQPHGGKASMDVYINVPDTVDGTGPTQGDFERVDSPENATLFNYGEATFFQMRAANLWNEYAWKIEQVGSQYRVAARADASSAGLSQGAAASPQDT
jgi:hypothetical protein